MSNGSNFPPPVSIPSPSLIRPSSGLEKSLALFALLAIIGLAITILTEGYRYMLIDKALNGTGDVSTNALIQSDNYVMTAWGLTIICICVASILLLMWINRTTKNLRSSGYNTEKGSTWAVWSFFIPIANFWFVYGTLKDLAHGLRTTDSSLTTLNANALTRFWLFTIAGTLVSRGSGSFGSNSDDFNFGDYQTEVGLSIIASALLIISFSYSRKFFTNLK